MNKRFVAPPMVPTRLSVTTGLRAPHEDRPRRRSNPAKSIWLVLLAFVFFLGPMAPSRSKEAGGSTNPEAVRKYFAQGLVLPLLHARLEKRDFVPLIEKLPHKSKVEILGDHDPRYDGIIVSYFNNVSYVARTRFEFEAGGDFIVVIQDGLKNWNDLSAIARKSANFAHISSIFESAGKRGEKLNSCEYIPLSSSKAITGGLLYVDTSMGFVASDVCLYQAVFSMFGFFVGGDPASGERNVVLDLTAIQLLYSMDEGERRLKSALNNLFSAYASQHRFTKE